MEIILITGKQGSGKTKKALSLIGLGERFIKINADNIGDKECLETLVEDCGNNIIIDEVESAHLHSIKCFIPRDGKILYRKPYTMAQKEYTITKLFILSEQNISKSFREGSFEHITL